MQPPSPSMVQDVPAAPEHPTLAKVYTVLDTHCARCHQRGKTGDRPPAAPVTSILDLQALAQSALVTPGLPDASPLLIAIQTRMAPHVFKGETDPATPELTSLDLTALRNWVLGLAPVAAPPSKPVPQPTPAADSAPKEPIVPPIVVVNPPDDPADAPPQSTPADEPAKPTTTPINSVTSVPSRAPDTASANPLPAANANRLTLQIEIPKTQFARDEVFSVRATASAPCHLTLIGVDARGRATVLFPSDFEPNNRIEPSKPVIVPPPGAGYRFRLSLPGIQTVVGHCSLSQKVPAGIKHDFERLRFTELGNYEAFVARAWDAANATTADNGDTSSDAARRARRERAGRDAAPPQSAPPGSEARTAIRLQVD